MLFEEFQDGHHGGHLGYWNGTVLAILNLYVALMPPLKLRLKIWEMMFDGWMDILFIDAQP